MGERQSLTVNFLGARLIHVWALHHGARSPRGASTRNVTECVPCTSQIAMPSAFVDDRSSFSYECKLVSLDCHPRQKAAAQPEQLPGTPSLHQQGRGACNLDQGVRQSLRLSHLVALSVSTCLPPSTWPSAQITAHCASTPLMTGLLLSSKLWRNCVLDWLRSKPQATMSMLS